MSTHQRLYVASDEHTPGFFDPLKKVYEVYMLEDFAHLWAPGSAWHTSYSKMEGPNPFFDAKMKVGGFL